MQGLATAPQKVATSEKFSEVSISYEVRKVWKAMRKVWKLVIEKRQLHLKKWQPPCQKWQVAYKNRHYTELPTPLRTSQTSGHSSFWISDSPLWSLKPPSSRWLKSSFFICPRVSARFLHCFCTVSRDAMGTLTCKIRQRMQKLHSEKSRCLAKK